MVIDKYGITLESISLPDMELMRYWRNQEHVRLNMEYREIITMEMQLQWFSALDKKTNLYFIIKKDTQKAGIIHLKDINRKEGIAEAGIFIGDIPHLNTIVPMLATIALMDFAFDVLNIATLKAKIGADNTKAILFNESIGYEKKPFQNQIPFLYFETNREKFQASTKNIRATLTRLNDDKKSIYVAASSEEMKVYGIDQTTVSTEVLLHTI